MIKENDSIVRYCKPTQIQDGKILVSAFLLRKKDHVLGRPEDEKELSVYQFEYYKKDPLKKIKIYAEKKMTLKPKGCFAVIKYSDVEKDIKEFLSIDIDIKQKARSPHCLIANLYQHDEDAAFYFVNNVKSFTKIEDLE